MNLNYIRAHVTINLKSIKVNWPFIVALLGYPISLLFVVYILSHGALLDFALIGGIFSAVAGSGITALGYIAFLKFDLKWQDLLIVTKISKLDYLLSHLIAELTWILPCLGLFIALDLFYGLLTPYRLVALLLLAGAVSIAAYAIAFWFNGIIKHSRHTWPIGLLLSLLMTTISPTFYPYTYIPKDLLYVLSILPTTPAAVLAQGIFGLAPMQWYMLPVLIIEVVVYTIIAAKLTRWGEK